MNRLIDKENKKDKFITDTLLPYLFELIEDSDEPYEVAEQVASMYIFPYRTNDGVRIGSMKEPGVSWYFDKDTSRKQVSSGGYRIFADEVIKPDHAVKFRQVFGEYDYIAEFSDAAVIKELLEKMSAETDYSDLWWIYAYDIFKVWNEEDFNKSLAHATKSMDNNSFLFLPDYCEEDIKNSLIKFNVFTDVVSPSSSRLFWNKLLTKKDREKAITMFKNMGVPCSFCNGGIINENLLNFLQETARECVYPVDANNSLYEICKLSHDVIWRHISKESNSAFLEIVNDDRYNAGIVVKNVFDEFVPLSWDLFYSNWEYQVTEEENNVDSGEKASSYVKIKTESGLESQHIDAVIYDKNMISGVEKIHEFSDVCGVAEEYELNAEIDGIEFYLWIWNYSKHEELIVNILYYFTDEDNERSTVPEQYNQFILDVISTDNVEDEGYSFNIEMEEKDAFQNSEIINSIVSEFERIYPVVYSDYESLDTSEYILQIIAVTSAFSDTKSRIVTDPIWDHAYLVNGDRNEYDDIYVRCKIYDNGYEDALILWPSDDNDSYIRALATYVTDTYDVEVSIAAAESFDWKAEYLKLARDIRNFMTETFEQRSIGDINGFVANMADIRDFGEERKVWEKLKEQRAIIINQTTGKMPVNLEGWRSFLSAKYKGRCQVCGGKTVTGEQNARFFTYRMSIGPGRTPKNQLDDMESNLLCLCPTCHGGMRYGKFMGMDLSQVVEKAERYYQYIEGKIISGEMEDDFDCLIQELVDEEIEIEGFTNPIVCNVMVNGIERKLAFSWEHFMKVAFILMDGKAE